MNRSATTTIALLAGTLLAGTALAQGRHDDKPHGYDQKKAAAAATKPAQADGPVTGGRHDEKPHGTKKAKAAPKATAPAAPKPAADTVPSAAPTPAAPK